MGYDIVYSSEVLDKVKHYIADLKQNKFKMGKRLEEKLKENNLVIAKIDNDDSIHKFLECLLNTKEPRLFAESPTDVLGADNNQPKWNKKELSILGDIAIAADNVTFFDNGHWTNPVKHSPEFKGCLLFIGGALLKPDHSPDRDDIVVKNTDGSLGVDRQKLKSLYERRLLPLFMHANENARKNNIKGFVNVPGLGCGEFAGNVKNAVIEVFPDIIKEIISENKEKYSEIGAFCISSPGAEKRDNIISSTNNQPDILFCNPFGAIQQLDHPSKHGDKYKNHKLFKLVAGDHASWPLNDWYVMSRRTDEGVMGAATNCMSIMTGENGQYKDMGYYPNDTEVTNWEEIVKNNKMKLQYDYGKNLVIMDVKNNKLLIVEKAKEKVDEPTMVLPSYDNSKEKVTNDASGDDQSHNIFMLCLSFLGDAAIKFLELLAYVFNLGYCNPDNSNKMKVN